MTLPVPHIPDLVQRYANGESLRTIALHMDVSRQTIYNWLLTGIGEEQHEQLVTKALVHRIADADGELDSAESMFDIARAREKMRYTRMDFERRRPHLYGPKQEVKHTGQLPSLVINVVPQQQIAVQHDIPGTVTIEHTHK